MQQILLGKNQFQKVLIFVYCGQDNLGITEIVVHLSEDFKRLSKQSLLDPDKCEIICKNKLIQYNFNKFLLSK